MFPYFSSKLNQSYPIMNNIFPPINGHSRLNSDELHGIITSGSAEMHATPKHQQVRRRHTGEQQRRMPLRSNSLLPVTGTRYSTKATLSTAAAAAATSTIPMSASILVKSSSMQSELAKGEL
jgi:hypothetical protein